MLLYQPQNGYCYNSDTHFLYNFISINLKKFKNIKGELLDVGSGSGILGLLIARDYNKLHLNQCEIQPGFQFYSNKNAQINKIDNKMYKGSFIDTDFGKSFDMIVSNPPFYHANNIKSENESLKIARYNDSMPLKEFISKAADTLKAGGKFFFCYDVKQINDIITYLNKNRLNIEALQFVHPKKDKDASLVMVYAREGSRSLMSILPPLIMFENNDFTDEVNKIYRRTGTHSLKCEI